MDWIALVSSLVGLVTAVAALLTVLEMRRQRVTLYRPDLAIPSTPLHIYAGTFSQIGNSVHCSSVRYNLPNEPPAGLPNLQLECHNVGLGAAKDLRVEWSFASDEIVALLNQLAAPHNMTVEFGEWGFELFDAAHKSQSSSRINMPPQTITYLLPVQLQARPQPVHVPSEYNKAIALYASYYLAPHDEQRWRDISRELRPALHVFPQSEGASSGPFPAAKAVFSYRDIGDNMHRREFNVVPIFSHIQQMPRDQDHIQEFAEGRLLVVPAARQRNVSESSPRRAALRYYTLVPQPPDE